MNSASTFAPYAALALLLAGLAWLLVGGDALKRRVVRSDILGVASSLTGIAFVLIFVAWLG